MNTLFCQGLAVLCTATFVSATTWTVDDDGKADFAVIQEAIDAAADRDEILVMPGTYLSSTGTTVVYIADKSVWLHSSDGPEVTILDGTGGVSDLASCSGALASDTIIDGFTITNGDGGDWRTGGVNIINDWGSC